MLNIQSRISLSKDSKRKVRKFWKNSNGNLDASSWRRIIASVKSDLSEKLLSNQGYKCVYCGRYLYGQAHEMDHFADKATYPRFSFNPVNIFYSCRFCNSPERKGQLDTVLIENTRYDQCLFDIMHPYYHDIDSNIFYTDDEKIYFDWAQCTAYGRETIVKLMLDDVFMTTIRSREITFQRLNPLTDEQELELIQLSIAYITH